MDSPSTTCYSKLVLIRAPTDESRCTINAKQHQGGFPGHVSGLGVGTLLPDIRVSVLGRGDDTVRLRGPVNGSDRLVVLWTTVTKGVRSQDEALLRLLEYNAPQRACRYGSSRYPGGRRSGLRWSSSSRQPLRGHHAN